MIMAYAWTFSHSRDGIDNWVLLDFGVTDSLDLLLDAEDTAHYAHDGETPAPGTYRVRTYDEDGDVVSEDTYEVGATRTNPTHTETQRAEAQRIADQMWRDLRPYRLPRVKALIESYGDHLTMLACAYQDAVLAGRDATRECVRTRAVSLLVHRLVRQRDRLEARAAERRAAR